MLTGNRLLLDLTILIYASSLTLFFWDTVAPKRWMNRAALLLLFLVFSGETALLLKRLFAFHAAPLYTRFDMLLLVSWLVLLVTLVVDAFFRVGLLVFFANVIAFGFVVFDSFAPLRVGAEVHEQADLLLLHVGFAILGYACFTLAFVFAGMYLLQNMLLLQKRWNRWFLGLPSLADLERFSHRSVLIGFPLLMVSMVLGFVWGRLVYHQWIWLDVKPIFTFLNWICYGVYLWLYHSSSWSRSNLMKWNVACFLFLLVNFFVGGDFSTYHPWTSTGILG